MSKPTDRFVRALQRRRRLWQTGLVLCTVLRLLGWCAMLFLTCAVLDFFLAFSETTRALMGAVLILVLFSLLVAWLVRVMRLSDRDMAHRSDTSLDNRRQLVLSAYELNAWLRHHPELERRLTGFLVQRNIDEARQSLMRVGPGKCLPVTELKREGRLLAARLIAVVLAAALGGAASGVIARRIVFPYRDIPPYSLYVFNVQPATPQVVYGGDVDVGVDISGGPVRSQVWFATRYGRRTRRVACFREGESIFAQRLERVVGPVEFCFVMGRARSRWHKVDLLMQPKIAIAAATITPPAYTRCPSHRFFVGNEDLAAVRGSRISLAITSNRPLLDGLMTIRSDGPGFPEEQSVLGERMGRFTVVFDWPLEGKANLSVRIRDLQGTSNAEPFRIVQKVVPDEPPEAVITTPAPFAMATPGIAMPLEGYATDDFGVARMELVRTVLGFRDRHRPFGLDHPRTQFEFEDVIDLGKLGVEPGQLLEFYLEAQDQNPSMMGVAASEVARVQIVSEEDYAALLRARTTVEEFMARYHMARDHMKEVKDALQELAEAEDEEARREALARSRQAMRKASELFDRMARDFAAFDLEEPLSNVVRALSETMKGNLAELANADPSDPGLGDLAGRMLAGLGGGANALAEQVSTAEEVAEVTRVMECAMHFRALVQRQTELVRALSRYEQGSESVDSRRIRTLGLRQEDIREDLLKILEDIETRAEQLPDLYGQLRETALSFVQTAGRLQIDSPMRSASIEAANGDGRETHRFASVALERLEQLLSDCCSGFGGMCQGACGLSFKVPRDLETTLEQMLMALAARLGSGSGSKPGMGGKGRIGSSGMGYGGDARDGYWMGGFSPLNIPIFGPERMTYGIRPVSSMVGGAGEGRGGESGRIGDDDGERMTTPDSSPVRSKSMSLDEVPERYREAVKRYFSLEE